MANNRSIQIEILSGNLYSYRAICSIRDCLGEIALILPGDTTQVVARLKEVSEASDQLVGSINKAIELLKNDTLDK